MVKETDISANDTGDSGAMMILARTMIGTMWRMFLPTIGLTLLGLWLDNVSGMKMRLVACWNYFWRDYLSDSRGFANC